MKRQKNLLILLGVLAGLCAVILLVTGVQKHIDKITTVDKDIVDMDTDSVTKISWTSGGKTLTYEKTDDVWQQSDDAAFPVDQEKLQELLQRFAPLNAGFEIGDVQDYGQYGLDSPEVTVTLTTADGDTVVKFGSYSTMDSKRYVTLGDGAVYLISDDVASELSTDRDKYLCADSVPAYDTITSITAAGKTTFTVQYLPDATPLYTDTYDYYAVDGDSYTALSTQKIKDFLSDMAALPTDDYATYRASQENLADYGMDTPTVTYTVQYTQDKTDGSFTLALGKKGDACYARMNDSEIIFKLTEEEYNDLTATGADALRPDEALSLDWDAVKSMAFTVDGATYTVEHKGDTFTINGDEVDFDAVKQAVDGLKISEYNRETTDKKQELAFTVTLDNKEHPELTVTIQQYDGENCLVTLNGTTLGFASRSNVVSLTEAVNAITLGLA